MIFFIACGPDESEKSSTSNSDTDKSPENTTETPGIQNTTTLLSQQDWKRDEANPIVKSNGNTISQMSDPTVLFDGKKIRMWFGSVGSDVNYASVGYSESEDGQSWSDPVIAFSPNTQGSWDDQKTEVPFVLLDLSEQDSSKKYKMWYGGSNSDDPDLLKIGYAYSPDGITWTRLPAEQSPFDKDGLVMVPGNDSPGDYAVVAEPTVIFKDGRYMMWYNSWDEDAIVISYAFSNDGFNWTKHPDNPILRHTQNSWESGGIGDGTVAQPTVIWDNDKSLYLILYGSFDDSGFETYKGIGLATSSDGVTWIKNKNAVFTPISNGNKGEENGISTGPSLILKDGIYHLWYTGIDSMFQRVIDHAILESGLQ